MSEAAVAHDAQRFDRVAVGRDRCWRPGHYTRYSGHTCVLALSNGAHGVASRKYPCHYRALKARCTTAVAPQGLPRYRRGYAQSGVLEGLGADEEQKKVEIRFAHMKRIHRLDWLRWPVGCEGRGAAHCHGSCRRSKKRAAEHGRSKIQSRPIAPSTDGFCNTFPSLPGDQSGKVPGQIAAGTRSSPKTSAASDS